MEFARRIVKPLFWAALVFAFVMAAMPAEEAVHISPYDKVEHMLAFLTLAILGKLAYPQARTLVIGLLLAVFGALIELTQIIPMLHRDAEFNDWIADSIAIGVGLVAMLLLARVQKRTR